MSRTRVRVRAKAIYYSIEIMLQGIYELYDCQDRARVGVMIMSRACVKVVGKVRVSSKVKIKLCWSASNG
jgi:hypothetical protein